MSSTSFLLPTYSSLLQKRNLLAFSAGVDSSALFFLLLENNIPFDIALVNYGTRENSDKEEVHAQALADKYHLTYHSIKAPKFTSNFEKNAREFRYAFFETLIKEPIKYIEILSDFLQIKPTGDKIPTFEELKKINPKFFRSGKTNSWKDVYSDEEHISFWLRNYKEMMEYGYDYKKPKLLNGTNDNIFLKEIKKGKTNKSARFSFIRIILKGSSRRFCTKQPGGFLLNDTKILFKLVLACGQ